MCHFNLQTILSLNKTPQFTFTACFRIILTFHQKKTRVCRNSQTLSLYSNNKKLVGPVTVSRSVGWSGADNMQQMLCMQHCQRFCEKWPQTRNVILCCHVPVN